ncbi:MAG: NAD(P)H-dependent oxidoreductase [Rikenellaceae bacterium]|nr:NAD(P)H-dependent oxidoreductase [Rikenellaceae bacterium]
MKKIAIISGSVRDGRMSHRVSMYAHNYLTNHKLAKTEILDLKEYDFPLFNERIMYQSDPAPKTVNFADKFREADGILIISPVYNGGFSAALKNAIDLLYTEWKHKPVAVGSVTYTATPGIATIQQLQTLLLKLEALVTPSLYTVINVREGFDDYGNPTDPVNTEKFFKPFAEEFLWMIDKV